MLDLNKIAPQIDSMVAQLKTGAKERQEHLQNALSALCKHNDDFENLKRKIAASKTTWLVAGLVDGLSQHYAAPPLPREFTVMATDGSNIDVDRHRSTRCFLINIGSVSLHYGASPNATLDSLPHLYSGEEDMVITPGETKDREQPIEGALLGIKRSVDECQRLAELAAGQPPGSSTLALIDGSLIMWPLDPYADFVKKTLLDEGYLHYLDEMRKLNQDRKLAIASYISFSRSNDVVNALRVAFCPREVIDTDRCSECTSRECDQVPGIRDRDLFINILSPGDRSAVFFNQSSIVKKHYGVHQVYFFYLRADDEIARVEIPRWVAMDEGLLNLTHTLVLDQCRRGQGYPVALSEAHEQAVVTGADREYFWQLVESSLVDEKLPSLISAKSQSKRTRWI